jgi:adenosine deaminase
MELNMRGLHSLPKVHVHAHLDGSFPQADVHRLARRHGRSFIAPRTFDTVDEFFAAYGEVPQLVESLDDLASLCRALVLNEARNGVVYLEPAIEPQLYAPRFGNLHEVTAVMVAALQAAGSESGIQVGANLTINTDQDLLIADDLVLVAAAFAGRGVTAFGTAGFVEPAGLARFREHAEHARNAGLQVVSHAGQTGGPDSVLEALDELGAARISHGVHAIHSAAVLERLARDQIVCDVCPISNVRLGVVSDLANHPARQLRAAGVPLTLNADDELWFGQSVTDQYLVARHEWNWSDEDLANVARTGARVPGLNDHTRARLLSSVDEWLTQTPTERHP